MAETLEHLLSRLDNLAAIEPLVSSMRILSLSTVQFAHNRLEYLEMYRDECLQTAALLNPLIQKQGKNGKKDVSPAEEAHPGKKLLIVFGSDRGIVGQYNRQLAAAAEEWAAAASAPQVVAFGTRLITTLGYNSAFSFQKGGSLIKGYSPDYERVPDLIADWLRKVDRGELSSVEILSCRKTRGNSYHPQVTPWLPQIEFFPEREFAPGLWPEPLVEEDPVRLIGRIREHMITISFYSLLFEAVAAENTNRYSRLEEAKDNLQSLIDELSLEIQIGKRQAVTAQIQEIAVSAGLVK